MSEDAYGQTLFLNLRIATGNMLKCFAMFTMLIDHIGVTMFPSYPILRYIGRLSFPIFIFLLKEGVKYSHDRFAYIKRLSAFALISQVPFSMAFYRTPFNFLHWNVFVTLAIGAFECLLLSLIRNQKKKGITPFSALFIESLLFIFLIVFAELIDADYGAIGILAIVTCFMLDVSGASPAICFIATVFLLMASNQVEAYAFAALPLILMYNGKRGIKIKALDAAFYLFYPVHLLILGIIR